MKQLTGMDFMFVQMERRHQYAHVAGLGIYDPSTAPGGKVRFKGVVAPVLLERLLLAETGRC